MKNDNELRSWLGPVSLEKRELTIPDEDVETYKENAKASIPEKASDEELEHLILELGLAYAYKLDPFSCLEELDYEQMRTQNNFIAVYDEDSGK